MDSILTATVGAKGQVTLPKDVRKILGILDPGELIGFVINRKKRKVGLAKLRVIPESGDEFSEEEYRKLLGLSRKRGGKTYASMQALLKDLPR